MYLFGVASVPAIMYFSTFRKKQPKNILCYKEFYYFGLGLVSSTVPTLISVSRQAGMPVFAFYKSL